MPAVPAPPFLSRGALLPLVLAPPLLTLVTTPLVSEGGVMHFLRCLLANWVVTVAVGAAMHGMVNAGAATTAARAASSLVLTPPVGDIDLLNWDAFDLAIERGYESTLRALEKAPVR